MLIVDTFGYCCYLLTLPKSKKFAMINPGRRTMEYYFYHIDPIRPSAIYLKKNKTNKTKQNNKSGKILEHMPLDMNGHSSKWYLVKTEI